MKTSKNISLQKLWAWVANVAAWFFITKQMLLWSFDAKAATIETEDAKENTIELTNKTKKSTVVVSHFWDYLAETMSPPDFDAMLSALKWWEQEFVDDNISEEVFEADVQKELNRVNYYLASW